MGWRFNPHLSAINAVIFPNHLKNSEVRPTTEEMLWDSIGWLIELRYYPRRLIPAESFKLS